MRVGVGVGGWLFFFGGGESLPTTGTQVNVLRLRQCKTKKGTRSCVRRELSVLSNWKDTPQGRC